MNENDEDYMQQFKDLQAQYDAVQKQSVCPSCGHCPHCGRGGHHFIPYSPAPSYPVQPHYPWTAPPYITWTVTSSGFYR
jgi:hypothetical protein